MFPFNNGNALGAMRMIYLVAHQIILLINGFSEMRAT